MTERENLPAVIAAQAVSVLLEQRGSLVGRGLAAIHGIQLSLPVEADVGKLFKQGMRYRYGEHGTQIDDEKARKYFTDASELNHAEAQFELAFLVGENGNQNESDQWLERSAHLGFDPALRLLVSTPDGRR